MTNISKQILLICAFAGASLGAASADPFMMPANGGMDPSLTPAARAKVDARDAAIGRAMNKLEGQPRGNGRVFGQVDFASNGDILLGGFDARTKGTISTSVRRIDQDSHPQRLGVGSGGTGGRIGLEGVPKVNTGGSGHTHNASFSGSSFGGAKVPAPGTPGAPKVPPVNTAVHIHTPR